MKTQTYKYGVILLTFVLFPLTLFAAMDEQTKVIKESFAANQSTTLEINNKFGDIDVKNWERDEISVTVTVTVESRDEDKAREILDDINVSFVESGTTIIATTEFGSNFDRGGFEWNKSNRYEFDLHYDVQVPSYINLTINNKYGDAFVNNIDGRFECEVSYGKIQINSLTRGDEKPLNLINVAYGGGTIQSMGWAKLNMKYSTIEIGQAKALISVSKYSKLYMDEGSSLVTESKYDTYKIGVLSNFVAAAGYSNFKFEEIREQFHMESKYSNARVTHIPESFEKINIESAYGRFNLGVEPGASYVIEGEAGYSKIFYPEGPGKLSRIEENTEMQVSGIVGNKTAPKAVVNIKTKYGNVDLTE